MPTPRPLIPGEKFDADGAPRPFPGLSIVSMLPVEAPLHGLLLEALAALDLPSYPGAFTPLPAPSLHMTAFDLICDRVRAPERWSTHVPPEATMGEALEILAPRARSVPAPEGVEVHLVELRRERTVCGVMEPVSAADGEALAAYREALSAVTGVRQPNHDGYFFHVSLAYLIGELTAEEAARFEARRREVEAPLLEAAEPWRLPAPTLVTFPDMFSFHPAAEGRS